ncbi:BamA/TamA family outer membrane protein [Sphingomonas flavalba]|uniref:autotransporter assembly complex protein TamA n=1 Tax=Sphingomonas flavalba TaxID=2559804 RepID=UPI0039E186F9
MVRHRLCGIAAIAGLLPASPALAQAVAPAPRTETQAPAASPVPEPPATDTVDPQSPLAPLSDIGVDWPDLTPEPAEAETTTAQTAANGEFRYDIALEGLDGIDADRVRDRFDALSVLHANRKKAANVAQLDRRAREDATLLVDLLRAEGYYDASVDTRVRPQRDGGGLVVTLDAEPGSRYTFAEVTVDGLAATGEREAALREAFGVTRDDPVDADKVIAGQQALKTRIGEVGFPFAEVPEPEVVIDHDTHTATLALNVETGGARSFGRIIVPDDSIFSARHIQVIARFEPGETFEASRLEDLRRALIQTGLVSTVKIEPVPGATPDTVDVAVRLERAPPRTIAGQIGYGTGEGARVEASWQHRNLVKPEGAVTFRGVAGTQEQSLGALLRQSNVWRRDHVITAQAVASHVDRAAYDAKSLNIAAGIERETNIIFQKKWAWSIGTDLLLSDERDTIGTTGTPRRRTFFIAALPGSLSYDGSDDLLNPTRGFRLSGRLSPELSLQAGTFGYARAQVDGSFYQPVSERIVLAGRVRIGTIAGAPADRIAPSRRYYAGGGGSVRGYGYQRIGPRDANNDPVGGRSLAEFSLEARVRLSAFGGAFGVVPFIDAGNIYRSEYPTFKGMRYGAGVGLRYYTNFGPIRIDVGTPLNRQPGDARIAVYVSLGQAF